MILPACPNHYRFVAKKKDATPPEGDAAPSELLGRSDYHDSRKHREVVVVRK